MKRCVVPGSYDPITNGHLDIIRRARTLCGHVTVGILENVGKAYMFPLTERMAMAQEAVKDLPDVAVAAWDGLLVDLLRKLRTDVVIRGVRNGADFASEQQAAFLNRQLYTGCETLLLPADPGLQAVSSSAVRELLRFGADVAAFVPPGVCTLIRGFTQNV